MQSNSAFVKVKSARRQHNEDTPEALVRSRKLNRRDRKQLRQDKRVFSEV